MLAKDCTLAALAVVLILIWDFTINHASDGRVGSGFDGGVQTAHRGIHCVELHQYRVVTDKDFVKAAKR